MDIYIYICTHVNLYQETLTTTFFIRTYMYVYVHVYVYVDVDV